jgi:hypothetical protein
MKDVRRTDCAAPQADFLDPLRSRVLRYLLPSADGASSRHRT